MAAPTPDQTIITILANRRAIYTPFLSSGGMTPNPIANATVAVWPDGVPTEEPSIQIAASQTDSTGRVNPGVPLLPGAVYRITTNNGSFVSCRFVASEIIGQVLVPGDNVSGA